MKQFDNSTHRNTGAEEDVKYLAMQRIIRQQIYFTGKKMNIDQTWGAEKFDELVDTIFFEKILKISKSCSADDLLRAIDEWSSIARGINAAKNKSYLKTTIKNAWYDIQKSSARKTEEKTVHLVSGIPLNHREMRNENLRANRGTSSIKYPADIHTAKASSPASEHVTAARVLFYELTGEERALLSLTYNDDLGLIEIGKRIGISKSTVKRKRDALIQRLRTFMLKRPELHLDKKDMEDVITLLLAHIKHDYHQQSRTAAPLPAPITSIEKDIS